MRKAWLMVSGGILVVVGIAGLVLPVIPGIAFIIGGGILVRAAVTGQPVEMPKLRRMRTDPDSAEA